jgi:senataxin
MLQSTEPSVLIALRRGCKQCVMVGDQQQLTATVFSSEARAALYDRSLFQRLIEIGHPYIMLDTQYRMHPAISAFPCRVFYGGHLKDGANVLVQEYLPTFLTTYTSASVQTGGRSTPVPQATLCPFMFLDLDTSREKAGAAGSQSNSEEAIFVSTLLGSLQQAAQRAGCKSLGSIGVITFYSDQLAELRRVVRVDRLNSRFPAQQACKVEDLELNTVDGFQGKEKDIIIISAVRANDHGGVGFISDLRRMNVALTRARKGLFVVGHAPTLGRDATWRALLDHAMNSGVFLSVPNAYSDVLDLLQRRTDQQQRQFHQQQLAMQHAVSVSASSVSAGDCGPTPSEPGPPASEGKIVVSSETVGWVSEGAAAGNLLRHSAANTTTRCKDRDYALADQLTTTRMKRKFQATEAEEGEIEE